MKSSAAVRSPDSSRSWTPGSASASRGGKPAPAARVVVRTDEGVVGDDGPLVVRVAEDEGAVPKPLPLR